LRLAALNRFLLPAARIRLQAAYGWRILVRDP
jgi:hypothetical protein